ncbi:MAG: hypothetical protein HOE90_10645 [Bacteriovoracaceae bacterium]|jgi:hypothetical protein|nr:hypothetical protein [Bacteriovoracaceae bacterium]
MSYFRFFLIITLPLWASCSLFETKTPLEKSYLTGEGVAPNIKLEDVQKALTRSNLVGLGTFRTHIYPITPAITALGPKLLTKTQANSSCFQMEISVIGEIKAALLEFWQLRLQDKNGEFYDLKFTEEDLKKSPSKTLVNAYWGKQKNYHNKGIACVGHIIDWKDGFIVTIDPKEMPWLMHQKIAFKWTIDPAEKVINYQDYRRY